MIKVSHLMCGHSSGALPETLIGGETKSKSKYLNILLSLVFKASSIKCAFVWRFSPEQLCPDLSRQTKSLFSLN